MTCTPAIFEISRFMSDKEKEQQMILKIIELSYYSVNEHYVKEGLSFFTHKYKEKKFYELWDTGPSCLFVRKRYRATSMARQIVSYYLMKKLGFSDSKSAAVFGFHRTSSIHSIKFIKGQLSAKHDNVVKDCWQTIIKTLN